VAERAVLLSLACEIVGAYVSNNELPSEQLPQLIRRVFDTLATVEQKTAFAPKAEPAVPVKRSVLAEHLVCLDCGKHFSMLKRHLRTDHDLTVQQYRQKWELPSSYPMVAPDYAKVRSALAKKIGLGRKGATAEKGRRMAARRK
jgi:predicted transcriptional regulator